MTIQYLKDGNFKWNSESAQRELLKYLFYNYSEQPVALNTLPKKLDSSRIQEDNVTSSKRSFGIKTYEKILNSAIKKIAKIPLSALDDYINVDDKTKTLLNLIDSDFTIGDMADENASNVALGDEGSNVDRAEKFKEGLSDKEVEEVLKEAEIKTVKTKDGGEFKSWILDETEERKIKKIKNIGYRRVTTKESAIDKRQSRRKVISFSGGSKTADVKQTTRRGEPDLNATEYTRGTDKVNYSKKVIENPKKGLESKWNKMEVILSKNPLVQNALSIKSTTMSNKDIVKRTELQKEKTKEILEAIDDFFVYEEKLIDGKIKNVRQETVTRLFSPRILSLLNTLEKDDDPKGHQKGYIKIQEITKRIQENSKLIDSVYALEEKLDISSFFNDDKQVKTILDLIEKTKLNVDIKELKLAKNIKSRKLLDKLFAEIDREITKKAKSFTNDLKALERYMKQRQSALNKLLESKKEEKEEFVNKNYDYSTQKDMIDYNSSNKAKELFDDIESQAKKIFTKQIKNLGAIYELTLQVKKTEAGKYIPTIEATKIKTISISSSLKGDTKQRRIVSDNLKADDKRDLAKLFRMISKRRRALDRIEGISG